MSTRWIEVDEVMAKAQARAKPFVDSPNDALRRLFGLEPASEASCAPLPPEEPWVGPTRARSGELLPLAEYELSVLRAVSQAGGAAWRAEVRDAVEAALADRLRPSISSRCKAARSAGRTASGSRACGSSSAASFARLRAAAGGS